MDKIKNDLIELIDDTERRFHTNLLLMYNEHFTQDELLTLTILFSEAIEMCDFNKMNKAFKLIEDKIKKLEGIEWL